MSTQGKISVVTGGAGFIGSHLVEALLARGYDVRVVDNLVAGKREQVPANATFFKADIRDRDALAPIFSGAGAIFHLAALPRVEYTIQNPLETHDVNVTGAIRVLDAAKATGAKRVVFASSAAVYGDREKVPFGEGLLPTPLSPYAVHKFIGEQYCALFSRLYGLNTVSLRFFNVYGSRFDPEGPYALVVGKFLKFRMENKPIPIVGDGTHTRDYVHVHDVVRGLIAASESKNVGKGEVINIGTGKETSVNELANLFGGERTYVPPRIEPSRASANIEKAKKLLDWEPTVSIEDGIAELKKELSSSILSS